LNGRRRYHRSLAKARGVRRHKISHEGKTKPGCNQRGRETAISRERNSNVGGEKVSDKFGSFEEKIVQSEKRGKEYGFAEEGDLS